MIDKSTALSVLIDSGVIWNNLTLLIGVIVLWIVSRSQAAKDLAATLSTLTEVRKKKAEDDAQEIMRLRAELKLTAMELRQAREFSTEDRIKINKLERKAERYEREINIHRLSKNIPVLLAGSEDNDNDIYSKSEDR